MAGGGFVEGGDDVGGGGDGEGAAGDAEPAVVVEEVEDFDGPRPFLSSTWVTSICQHSLGRAASKRT